MSQLPISRDTTRANRWADILGLTSICGMLSMALAFELLLHDLPCPLCLLQRLAFSGIGFGFLCNILLGRKVGNYSIVILFSLFGLMTALRQVLLHIVPGSGSYGPPLLGWHFYTWADIAFLGYLGYVALVLLTYTPAKQVKSAPLTPPWYIKGLALWFFGVLLGNVLSTIGLCGIGICPDNPLSYSFY